VLHLQGGGRIAVRDYWVEGDTLYYETDAGVVGIPRARVVRIDDHADEPPATMAGAAPPREAATPESGVPHAAEPPAGPGPPATGAVPRRSEKELRDAIARLETELRRAGTREQRARIAVGLANLHVLCARRAATRGELDAAEADYERALDVAPDHRTARLELGWLELRAGRPLRARSLVETGLAASPGDPWLLELRGELSYRDNRLQDALDDLRTALRARKDDERLQRRIAKIERELRVERDYTRSLSSHFELRYEGDRDEAVGRILTDVLESAWVELTRELEVYPTQPVTVTLYTQREFHDTTRTGSEVAGLYDGKIRLPVGGVRRLTPALRRVARHELVHALLHAKAAGPLPRWLHEGLAQFLEPRNPRAVASRLASAAADGRLGLEPFSYAKSLSFVAFLDGAYGRTRLLWLVEKLAAGLTEDDAFLGAYNAHRAELIDEWRRSLSEAD